MPREESERSEETRRAILRVAQQLFMEHGYRAVSTRQIADACGLTQPALYHYFTDKQDLYVAVVREELARTQAALERIAGRGEAVEERLRKSVLFLLSAAAHDHMLMLHDIRYELNARQRAALNDEFQSNMIAPLASIFADGMQQGLLRDQQNGGLAPAAAAYLLLNMVAGFLTGTPAPGGAAGNDTAGLIVRLLLHGLATA
jgi:AcrR family transcriptional regulator